MSTFPQPFTSTVSHWQATNRGPTALWNHGRSEPLPTDVVDYVIVGGGITGTSLAYQLTRPDGAGEGKSVVLLEAKDVASGATGRNGGHIAPASWGSFPSLTAALKDGGAGLSDEQALEVLANELDTLNLAEEIIKKEKLDVGFWRGRKLEVKTTPEGHAASVKAREAFLAAKSKSERFRSAPLDWDYIEGEEAKVVSRVPTAVSVNRGSAGTCHPHRLATALARLALGTPGFKLFSWTPVSSISKTDLWKVDCEERGVVTARNVVLSSNGHTRHLAPWLKSHVTPFRGHAALITPPTSMSGPGALTHSYALERGPYLMSTPHSGIVFGVYNASALSEGIATKSDIFEVVDDSVVLPTFKEWLGEYCGKTFEGWSESVPGEGLARVWTGIMGHSRDHLPLIGSVPGQPGLYAAVAFHGHGMARILTCTRALAHQLKTGEWDQRLPRCFEITEERLKKAAVEAPLALTPEEVAVQAGSLKI